MTEYVRARVPREGAPDLSRTTSAIRAAAAGWEVLEDEPTHDASGRVLPETTIAGRRVKPQTSVAKAAAEKAAKSASSTDTEPSEKES